MPFIGSGLSVNRYSKNPFLVQERKQAQVLFAASPIKIGKSMSGLGNEEKEQAFVQRLSSPKSGSGSKLRRKNHPHPTLRTLH
jgi:hypothetical protein